MNYYKLVLKRVQINRILLQNERRMNLKNIEAQWNNTLISINHELFIEKVVHGYRIDETYSSNLKIKSTIKIIRALTIFYNKINS